ncbi:hypothetical protein FHG87_018791 [Trinorchestia longiramus]|nr:hypothetical protein FHG87_018791 [Trinorchestia longiramus]
MCRSEFSLTLQGTKTSGYLPVAVTAAQPMTDCAFWRLDTILPSTELGELQTRAKRDFETMKLEEFWVKYLPMYPKVGEEALRVILPFSSTYLCEAGFSALVVLKTKQHNRLDVENDLRCALSSFNPRISDLVRKKQQHPPH